MLCTCLLIYDDQNVFPGVTANFTKKTTFKTQLEGKNSKGRSLSFHFFRFYHGIILSDFTIFLSTGTISGYETSLSLGQYIKVSVWDFPVKTKQTRLISYLLYGLVIMDLSLRPIKTNTWWVDNFKTTATSTQRVVNLRPRYGQMTLVSECPFWQLSIDHNI